MRNEHTPLRVGGFRRFRHFWEQCAIISDVLPPFRAICSFEVFYLWIPSMGVFEPRNPFLGVGLGPQQEPNGVPNGVSMLCLYFAQPVPHLVRSTWAFFVVRLDLPTQIPAVFTMTYPYSKVAFPAIVSHQWMPVQFRRQQNFLWLSGLRKTMGTSASWEDHGRSFVTLYATL